MLKRWTLKNFKSFKAETALEFAPINILAGANSSGKSSLIQSILLLKQTLQYGAENRPVTLNGPLLRLGTFNDVRSAGAKGEELKICFKFEFGTFHSRNLNSSNTWLRNFGRTLSALEQRNLSGIEVDIAYCDSDDPAAHPQSPYAGPTSLNPLLSESRVSVLRGEDAKDSFAALERMSQSQNDEEGNFPYAAIVDEETFKELSATRPGSTIRGAYASHFLPQYFAVDYDLSKRESARIAEELIHSVPTSSLSEDVGDIELDREIVDIINQWIEENSAPDPLPTIPTVPQITVDEAKVYTQRVIGRIRPLRNRLLGEYLRTDDVSYASVQKFRDRLLIALLQNRESVRDVDLLTARPIAASAEFVRTYFKHGVKYLGPLRDSPKPVYQPEALESTTDVGYRGENTAAVLDLNSSRPVSYTPPPMSADDNAYVEPRRRSARPLHDAVVEWMTYLGVAIEVKTTDAGVYGNRLQVATSVEDELHDLTNVGVGVSQVLPIVVMALLAPPGSLLIFEQPELHLHPRVQARLADFFIALAFDNKQTLLETHSEYLVDRFRLRIALSQDDSIRSLVNILFSEKTGRESTLTPVKISEYGAIENWPADFFEQSQKDIARLIRAAALKRKNKAAK